MVVFSLNSDEQFIQTFKGSPYIYVYEHAGDPNAFEMIHADDSTFHHPPTRIAVSPFHPAAAATEFNEIEVFGVTIRGNQLAQLFNDLTLADADGKTFHLLVNRQGLCFLEVGSRPVKRLRINDLFGWAKYGVVPKIRTIWSVWDMSNGAVFVAPPTLSSGSEDDGCEPSRTYLQKLVEEKSAVVEKSKETESALRKLLEERDKEVAALKAAMKAVWDK